MKERVRAPISGRFVKEFTEEDFIYAVQECLQDTTVTAAEVAEKLNCNPRFARNELNKIATKKGLTKVSKGKGCGFKL
jgi:MarR-like DNA-binding transcriptional regulator SgrR of sgrS sRNA